MRAVAGLRPTTINRAELREIVGKIERRASDGRGAREVTLTVATEGPRLGALAPRAHGTDRLSSLWLTRSRGTARSVERVDATAAPSPREASRPRRGSAGSTEAARSAVRVGAPTLAGSPAEGG